MNSSGQYRLTHSWYPTRLYFTPQPLLYFQPIAFHHFPSISVTARSPRRRSNPDLFSSKRWQKRIEMRTRKAAPSSLTVSFSVIHRLPSHLSSLRPALLFLWPLYFTPIAVNPARSLGGILKAALLSVFSSPSLPCSPGLMYTSHFIEVCML